MDFTVHKGEHSFQYKDRPCFGQLKHLIESVSFEKSLAKVKNPDAVEYFIFHRSQVDKGQREWLEYLLSHKMWGSIVLENPTVDALMQHNAGIKVSAQANPHFLIQTLSMFRVLSSSGNNCHAPEIFKGLVDAGANEDAAAYCSLLLTLHPDNTLRVVRGDSTESCILSTKTATIDSLNRYVKVMSGEGYHPPYYTGKDTPFSEAMTYHRNEQNRSEGLAGWLTEYINQDKITSPQLIDLLIECEYNIVYDKEAKKVLSHSRIEPELPKTAASYKKLADTINSLIAE